MEVLETINAFRARCASAPSPLGLVPTMGALHEGHLSLVRRARSACSSVALSIFVNPAQFAPSEDLARYPRPIEQDLQQAEASGVDLVFRPAVEEMYPPGFATFLDVGGPAVRWEGERRPGHFRGVATIVAKLLTITTPQQAFFGEKDFQQLTVVRRLVSDLALPIEIVGCPIVREADGLARSSRNVYLSPTERLSATALYRALEEGRQRVAAGERDVTAVRGAILAVLEAIPGVGVEYVAVVAPQTLEPLERIEGPARALIAARLGRVRLIDNISLTGEG